jgi:hypothetical protein
MNELKIQLATLGKTLEALEDRIERRIWIFQTLNAY